MNARDITVSELEKPELSFEEPPPAHFSGVSIHDMKSIRFRCPHCGVAHRAAVLPHSPQTAKFKCRTCDHVVEIETRPSAMDAVEQEFELRLDMKKRAESPKVFSIPSRSAVGKSTG